jgi:drug/metabolite transporter (DMT)-like permease
MKQLGNDGYDSTLFLIWLHIIMIGFLILHYWRNDPKNFSIFNKKILTDYRFMGFVIVGGFMSYITHYYGYGVAFLKFKNPGYFQALMGLELLGITVFAALLFGSDLGLKEILGILFIIIGSVIITWTENSNKSLSIRDGY